MKTAELIDTVDSEVRRWFKLFVREKRDKDVEKLQVICLHDLVQEDAHAQIDMPKFDVKKGDTIHICWDCRKFLRKAL